jgi:hypothetical protein
MKNPTSKSIITGLIICLFFGCKKNNPSENIIDCDHVVYGKSFGMCIGYCTQTIKISENQIEFEAVGRDTEGVLPPKRFTTEITDEEWTTLLSKINSSEFNQLKPIIGCPDCADGGAEWIEIRSNGNIHKTVFEYGLPPETTVDYIQLLRGYLALFNQQN